MKKIWDPVVQSVTDLQKTAGRLLDSGIKFFRTHIGSIPLFTSGTVFEGGDRDETHYLLVPTLQEEENYTLYRIPSLPNGVGPVNDLPKAQVFHLPASGSEEMLIGLLTKELKGAHLETIDSSSPLADRLQMIADEIDQQSESVSGGLIMIGSAIVMANPLLGIGIAAGSLIPSLGSKLTTHGIEQAFGWLKGRREKTAESEAETVARREVKKLKTETRQHRLLSLLGKTLHDQTGEFDPMIESPSLWDEPTHLADMKLGIEAITAVYQNRHHLSPTLLTWIDHLEEITSSSG